MKLEFNDWKWEDYGYANGWLETPERVLLARQDPEAQLTSRNVGRCETEYICEKYKFKFRVDSSD